MSGMPRNVQRSGRCSGIFRFFNALNCTSQLKQELFVSVYHIFAQTPGGFKF